MSSILNEQSILTWLGLEAEKAFTLAFGEPSQHGLSSYQVEARECADRRFGDYQLNGVLPLAKVLKENPRALAGRLLAHIDFQPVFLAPEIAGPGFINLRLSKDFLGKELGARLLHERLGIGEAKAKQKVIVDFSSPNIAKKMHVGHLRSTIIGDAIYRSLKFLGHDVHGDNHIGDWGTQFGILLWAFKREANEDALKADPIGELERLYKLGAEAKKTDEAIADLCREELVKLQAGDPENKALWERFVAISREDAERVYKRLNVSFDSWHGESFYHDRLEGIVQLLQEKGLAVETEGAIGVFFHEKGLPESPMLVKKKDGAFLYATSDLATLQYRLEEEKAERIIYVVDVRQSLHFKQVFHTARALHWEGDFVHVGFGMMLGKDGRPFRTREGTTVELEALLEEAKTRILPLVKEKWGDASEEEQDEMANAIGTGAVKYADLSQNRLTDYQFDWDKLLAAEGNTGPYLQYALVRTLSVMRQYEERFQEPWEKSGEAIALESPEEILLASELLKFHDVLLRVGEQLSPHVLCDYLYNLAKAFSSMYAACPILKGESANQSRMQLVALTHATLDLGLQCLNISRVKRM